MRFKGLSQGSCEKFTCTSRYGPDCLALLRNSSLTIRAMVVAEKTTVASITVSTRATSETSAQDRLA
jgi:hypothetical protein